MVALLSVLRVCYSLSPDHYILFSADSVFLELSVLSEHVICVSVSVVKPSVLNISFSSLSGLDSNLKLVDNALFASNGIECCFLLPQVQGFVLSANIAILFSNFSTYFILFFV